MSYEDPYGAQGGAQGAQGGDAPPGWYPTGDGYQRYWDGRMWTEHQAPLVPVHQQGYYGGHNPANDNGLALFAHLGGAFLSILVPLVIYLVKKDESPYLRHHGAEALNFQITMLLAFLVSFVLIFVLIGFLLIFVVLILNWVLAIVAAIAASKGQYYRYPLTLRFVS